jgi:hypothetical protein
MEYHHVFYVFYVIYGTFRLYGGSNVEQRAVNTMLSPRSNYVYTVTTSRQDWERNI